MSHKPQKEPCENGCDTLATERNRYFTGKYMTARDFAGEQAYFLTRQRLHNRLHHGWGVVCGLRVIHHSREDQRECKQRWVVIKAGIAIDCCGREIFVREDTALEVPIDALPSPDLSAGVGALQIQRADKPPAKGKGSERGREQGEEHHRKHDDDDDDHDHDHDHDHDDDYVPPVYEGPHNGLLLCVYYEEQAIEPVPALYAEGQCDPQHHEANRIKEVARFEFKRLDEMHAGCWRMPNGRQGPHPCQDDCDEPLPGPSGGCLQADCPCDGCVPLALLYLPEQQNESAALVEPLFGIDLRGRRQLNPPAHYLTHVVGINWPHGGEISLHELRERMGGQLKVHFDRKVLAMAQNSTGTGVNRRTFTVQFGGIQQGLEFLPSLEHAEPRLENDGCTAVYSISPNYLRGRENIANTYVYVTLHCDFVLDCHEMPIDGNHLSGRLPSGNGFPGGEFLSWFRVVHDHHHDEDEETD